MSEKKYSEFHYVPFLNISVGLIVVAFICLLVFFFAPIGVKGDALHGCGIFFGLGMVCAFCCGMQKMDYEWEMRVKKLKNVNLIKVE